GNLPDLVVGGTGAANTYGLAVLLNTTSGGTLSFAVPNVLPNSGAAITMPITSLAVGHVDGTPTNAARPPGIAATSGGNSSQLLVFKNDGTGTFSSSPSSINLNAPATGITLQDVNGDKRNDILIANNAASAPGNFSVLINNGSGGVVNYVAPVSYQV